jgi:hypothetical protein
MTMEKQNDGKWLIKREISLPALVALLMLVVSIVAAYYVHDSRISMLESNQKTLMRVYERDANKLARMEEKMDHMYKTMCDMNDEMRILRRQKQ